MIDAGLYRVFYTVAMSGTVSAAAVTLHVSQPAVSKSVKKLEELTGCTLFFRSVKGVSLTTEGHILFEYVKNAFAHLQNGERILKRIREKGEGLVRVGISNTLCRYYFMPCLAEFHRRYPGIKITIVNRTSPETLQLLEQGKIDFGIISIPRDTSRFFFRELLTIEDIFVAGSQYPELRNSQSLSSLAGYPLMMLEKNNVTREYVDACMAERQAVLQPEIEIGSLDFLVEFARIGLGVALVIKNFVLEELRRGLLFEIPVLPRIPPRKVGIVTPKNVPLSLAAEAFISLICGMRENNPGKEREKQLITL
ncbi:MAG: LysR family transcriptional regulator [Desulfobulbaceae bacterium BRH_c16a]|nr:MAG: LysR family transcriptional regulator [Desulfobulbaceae bacterium BRH_c16a]